MNQKEQAKIDLQILKQQVKDLKKQLEVERTNKAVLEGKLEHETGYDY